MADQDEAGQPDRADRMAAVCAHLEEIREDLRSGPGGDEGPVEQVLAAARYGGEIEDALAVLHAILQAGGDPHGLDGYAGAGGSNRGTRPVGISRNRLSDRVYLCPAGQCARYWWPQGPTAVPHCSVSDTALRQDRL